MTTWNLSQASEQDVRFLAELIALKVAPGDVVAMHGDLGAGKTTFARALIRALLDDASAEVPSPTFSLQQLYATPRLQVAHLDLYRIADAGELEELGLDEALASGILLVEWPERAPSLAASDRLDVRLSPGDEADVRCIELSGQGSWAPRLARLIEIHDFLSAAHEPPSDFQVRYLQGDASPRAYARLTRAGQSALLMDAPRQPDGPPVRNGLPYSRIAHLAEDVRPFVAIDLELCRAHFSVPKLRVCDLDRGLLLIEDLGDLVFGRLVAGVDPSQSELWRAATDTLVALRRLPVADMMTLSDGVHGLPRQDRDVLMIEAELLVGWYWPYRLGLPVPASARDEFVTLWDETFEAMGAAQSHWVLRDYHSPNLIWLPDRAGPARVGILDFQDALRGHPAYDLVSLLQDARVDVSRDLETVMFAHYCEAVTKHEIRFDRDEFAFSYAALGAQRATKILGIFARLAKRDNKPGYLRHMPRVAGYLGRNLAHPRLARLAGWYERHLGLVPASQDCPTAG